MSTRIRVRCPDPAVRRHLETWLEEGRLVPPAPLALDILLQDPTMDQEDHAVTFQQPGVSLRLVPPGNRLLISWETAPAVAELRLGEPTARVLLSRQAVERIEESTRTFFLTVLVCLLRRVGWHHVHGGTAVDPRGRGWLLAGDSHSGKSTTTALVSSRGWAVGTDDIAFLAAAGGRVVAHAFRSRIALRPGGQALLARAGGARLHMRGKVGFWPDELGGAWVPRVEPEIVLFTAVGDDVTRIEALERGETLAGLIRWSAWVVLEPALARQHLDVLTLLSRQCRGYQASLGRDLFKEPDLLARLVS